MSWPAINGSQADGEEDDPDLFDYDPFEDLPEEESLMSPKVSGTETERLDAQRRKTVQVGVLQRGTSSLSSESQASLHEPDLLAVLAVLRHGDRTPKQKVKLKLQVAGCVEDPRFFLGMLIGSILGTDMALRVRTVQVGAFDLRSSEQMRRLHDLLQAVRVEECKPKDAPREASDSPVVTNASQPSLPIEPDSPENKDGTKSAPADVLRRASTPNRQGAGEKRSPLRCGTVPVAKANGCSSVAPLRRHIGRLLSWGMPSSKMRNRPTNLK